ncbi:MAG: ThuA domain-containing protein [Gammaproteobacteria bacterium]|jgi:type 1 glutamine amidotransferase|nr:ThuA domain-containing protein [Gammaproteobacteria bacterium]
MDRDGHDVLLITKGHPFEREPFFAVFDQLAGVRWTHVEQPAAQALFDPEHAAAYDAFVLYDMPGIEFRQDGPPLFLEPDERFKARFRALLDAGQGFVFLHHAIAGWPAWPEYADVIGGRFLYLPDTLRGRPRQDSGYRHDVTHQIRVLRDHPVTAGVPEQFSITDELYLYEVFEEAVTPLLASDHAFVADNFYSAARVVRDGRMFDNEGWHHEPGSNLIGWTREVGRSRIVYLQCGDAPAAYANPHFQRLLGNAISWAAGAG